MKAKKKSLFNEKMKDDKFKKKFETQKNLFELEYQIAMAMESQGITQAELAKRLDIDKSVVSKDMSGALKKAGMKKLQEIAEALNCEFVPMFIPKEDMKEFEHKVEDFLHLKRA
jgi:transcriptional regulator with XRE-family HTH domain